MSGIGCFLVFCFLQMTFARYCEKSSFDHEPTFDDHEHFGDLLLAAFPAKTLLGCSRECHRNSSCTVFSFNTDSCVLYGNVLYRGTTGKPPSPARRYYFFSTAACPLEKKFTMFRSSNMCIRLLTTNRTYTEGKEVCVGLGGRPIVLEEETKANAVLNILGKSGTGIADFIYIGGTRIGSSNNFEWADGQPMVRHWWNGQEPNAAFENENCVVMSTQGLYDIGCSYKRRLLCEVPLGN